MIQESLKASPADFFRVFYPQASRRGIPGIGERGDILFCKSSIVFFKTFLIHQDFSPYFYYPDPIPGKCGGKGNRAYLFYICCNIIPGNPVPAGGSTE